MSKTLKSLLKKARPSFLPGISFSISEGGLGVRYWAHRGSMMSEIGLYFVFLFWHIHFPFSWHRYDEETEERMMQEWVESFVERYS